MIKFLLLFILLFIGCSNTITGRSPVATPTQNYIPPTVIPAAFRMDTNALAIPQNLTPSAYSDLGPFDLSAFGADFVGVTFTITIQPYTDASNGQMYRFKEPRLNSPSKTIHVHDIQFKMNGVLSNAATDFETIDVTVTPPDSPLLSSLTSSIPVQGTTDTVAISFGSLKVSTPIVCHALPTFVSNVLGTASTPNSLVQNCFGCHANPAHPAKQFLDMTSSDDAVLCAKILQRALYSNPSQSPLILNPMLGYNDMPPVLPAGHTLNLNSWIQWIQTEAASQ